MLDQLLSSKLLLRSSSALPPSSFPLLALLSPFARSAARPRRTGPLNRLYNNSYILKTNLPSLSEPSSSEPSISSSSSSSSCNFTTITLQASNYVFKKHLPAHLHHHVSYPHHKFSLLIPVLIDTHPGSPQLRFAYHIYSQLKYKSSF